MLHVLWTTRSSGRFVIRPAAGRFRERGRDFYFSLFWQPTPTLSDVGPTYFEVMFSKSGSLRNEHWRVCIELDDDDRALLISRRSSELGTRAVVRRSGILDLLPAGPGGILATLWDRPRG
jgi:hypothetical protein